MGEVRSWLPAEAVGRGVRALPVRDCVRGWSAAWFAGTQADIVGDAVREGAPRFAISWSLADGIALACPADIEARLAALVYGAPDDPAVLTAADRALLDAAAGTCAADLRSRLATALQLDGASGWRPVAADQAGPCPSWRWRVSDGDGAPLLELVVSEDLIVRRLRGRLPPVPARPVAATLATALADQPVAISALVGRGRITTTELAGLAPGDILLLDRGVADPADLAVDHRPQSLRCAVDRQDGTLQLTIV